MTYTITIENPGLPTETHTRKRRDAAVYLFRQCVFNAIKSRAILDRPAGVRAMQRAGEVNYRDVMAVSVAVQDMTIRFRAAA